MSQSARTITDLEASRVEVLFHRRRAIGLEIALLEKDELALMLEIGSAHQMRPGEFALNHVDKTITPTAATGPSTHQRMKANPG